LFRYQAFSTTFLPALGLWLVLGVGRKVFFSSKDVFFPSRFSPQPEVASLCSLLSATIQFCVVPFFTHLIIIIDGFDLWLIGQTMSRHHFYYYIK
jgi:hypothetical protein